MCVQVHEMPDADKVAWGAERKDAGARLLKAGKYRMAAYAALKRCASSLAGVIPFGYLWYLRLFWKALVHRKAIGADSLHVR